MAEHTFFSTPKPFQGLFGTIQRNAIVSWTLLTPRPEIILFGDDEGTAKICEELGLRHVPAVRKSGRVPLVSDMFAQAQTIASADNLTFLNADIIVGHRFLEMTQRVRMAGPRYLAVGQRTDVSVSTALEPSATWVDDLVHRPDAQLMPANWIDHFTFPRGLYAEIPDFAIGRSGYDNWLLWRASASGGRLVDVTPFCAVIHQRHDYSHGGGSNAVFSGEDAARARNLIGHWSRYHGVTHARWMLSTDGAVVPARSLRYRLARPRRAAAHALRFTVPVRRRVIDWRLQRRLQQNLAVDR